MNLSQAASDYQRVEKAIGFLESHVEAQPELSEIARAAGLSEYHFQRLFRRWVGISPKRFLQFLTKEHARQLLDESYNLLDTTFETGLTSPGRLHDLFIACEAVTPGMYKSGGVGLLIRYGIHETPFGDCLIAETDRGICNLAFLDDDRDSALALLAEQWPGAELREDTAETAGTIQRIFDRRSAAGDAAAKPLQLLLKGTNFQIKVWEALINIPEGALASYKSVAKMIGNPRAVRAAAGAVANNPIAYLIPCHRVIRNMGIWNNYRWGNIRKKAILGWEFAKTAAVAE